jgi:transcriptional regulator with XRE-family HTH domain
MIIGDRLRIMREEKKLSQGDIEKRTGLLRCYISRVECGHTVPAVETIEKFARALEVPIYQIFYDGDEPPAAISTHTRASKNRKGEYGATGKQARVLDKFRKCLAKMDQRERAVLLAMAGKMASR